MRRKHLTLLLAVSLLLTQARPALAQSQPADAQPRTQPTPQPVKPAAPPQSQTAAPLDKRAEKVRQRVQKIGLSQTVTVIMPREDDLHGTIINIGEQSFDLAEVDLRQTITVRYVDVKKVRSGYTPPRLFTGDRNSSPKGVRIAAFAGLIASLALPLILIASAKD
jgi:hypothetical protein